MGTSTRALRQEDFSPLAVMGWGDGWNAYAHSMTWFAGQLYCGSFRANLCFKQKQQEGRPAFPVWPIKCPTNLFEIDLRAQIWRFDPAAVQWENVYRAPIVTGLDGKPIQRECGYRCMAVVRGKSDTKPTLYVTPFSNTRSIGPVILRSEDGREFRAVSKPGLGYPGASSFRFLTPFKGKLYTSLVGSTNNVANESRFPIVFESADPASGAWRAVSEPGFGQRDNSVIFAMASLNDHLYAGTFNHVDGFQLWKTRAEGKAPYRWQLALDLGAGRGNLNEGVLSLCAFKGALYLGTCIQDGGYDRVRKIGPAAAEVIRVYEDDTWDLLVGMPRLTEQGFKQPTSGLGPGFDNLFNGYLWQLCVHEGRLYAGTLSWSSYLPFVDVAQWPQQVQRFLNPARIKSITDRRNGCELWSTADGDTWQPVTLTGFRNPYNCGARTVVSTPIGLAVGTVNPFGPEVAVKRSTGAWIYVLNPRGGAEVWLGSPQLPTAIRQKPPLGS
jgi:hypothetical protein